jgi:hypothetical protein
LIDMAEWQVSVPLMIYLNLTLDTKKSSFSLFDLSIVASSYFSIFFGFILAPMFDFKIASLCIIGASFLMIFSVTSTMIQAYTARLQYFSESVNETDVSEFLGYLVSEKRFSSCLWICLIFPLYPAVYFSRAGNLIDHTTTSILFATLNFVSKCVYILILMEGHLDVLDSGTRDLLAQKKKSAQALGSFEAEKKKNALLQREIDDLKILLSSKSQ